MSGEDYAKQSGPSVNVKRKDKTTKFKISRNKSLLSTLQVVFSSCSSLGNPPFLWKKQPNCWWNRWTKPQSKPKSVDSTTLLTSLDHWDWFGRPLCLPASLGTNGQEHSIWSIWSWKNSIAKKTRVWTSWTTSMKSRTRRNPRVLSFSSKEAHSVPLFALSRISQIRQISN